MSDLISRQAVIEAITKTSGIRGDTLKALYDLPSVENKGEWIEHDIKELRDSGYYRCSVCRKGFKRFDKGTRKSDVPWIDGQPFELHIVDNYCPNCGARMKGGE